MNAYGPIILNSKGAVLFNRSLGLTSRAHPMYCIYAPDSIDNYKTLKQGVQNSDGTYVDDNAMVPVDVEFECITYYVDSVSGGGAVDVDGRPAGLEETGGGSKENPWVNLNTVFSHDGLWCWTNSVSCSAKIVIRVKGVIDYVVDGGERSYNHNLVIQPWEDEEYVMCVLDNPAVICGTFWGMTGVIFKRINCVLQGDVGLPTEVAYGQRLTACFAVTKQCIFNDIRLRIHATVMTDRKRNIDGQGQGAGYCGFTITDGCVLYGIHIQLEHGRAIYGDNTARSLHAIYLASRREWDRDSVMKNLTMTIQSTDMATTAQGSLLPFGYGDAYVYHISVIDSANIEILHSVHPVYPNSVITCPELGLLYNISYSDTQNDYQGLDVWQSSYTVFMAGTGSRNPESIIKCSVNIMLPYINTNFVCAIWGFGLVSKCHIDMTGYVQSRAIYMADNVRDCEVTFIGSRILRESDDVYLYPRLLGINAQSVQNCTLQMTGHTENFLGYNAGGLFKGNTCDFNIIGADPQRIDAWAFSLGDNTVAQDCHASFSVQHQNDYVFMCGFSGAGLTLIRCSSSPCISSRNQCNRCVL